MKVRVRFHKTGRMKFIGHLDTQRYFQKLNRRAGINVAYSEGFSPHQKLSFAMPLSVGWESTGEYFDMELKDDSLSPLKIVELLNDQGLEEMKVTSCTVLPERAENAMASVRAADYHISFREEPPFDMSAAVADFHNAEAFIVQKENKKAGKKKGRRDENERPSFTEVDLKKTVHSLIYEDGCLKMRVSSGSKDNTRPELVCGALYERAGYELPRYGLMITRRELYTDGMIPLGAVGQKI